ncbi:MAG: 30S ribosomal protein S8 [Patescibacteria group bacterium UBA2103]
MVNDPIGDLIIQIKNAGAIRKDFVELPHSTHKHDVAAKLKDMGYVADVEKVGKEKPSLKITLSYKDNGTPKITDVKRLSKPGRRLYTSFREAHPVKYGEGAMLISTPKGILSDSEARQNRVGGEMLFKIW